MKKLIYCLTALFSFCNILCAHAASPTGTLHIQTVESTTGYYSVKIYSKFPSNRYEVKGLPTSVHYLITRINNFIKNNLKDDKTATIQFGISDGQDENDWFTTGPCYIQLPKDENIVVTIQSKTSCFVNSKSRASYRAVARDPGVISS